MPPVKSASPRQGAGRPPSRNGTRPKLPPVTVGKLEETGRLLERVIASNQSLFVAKGQDYREIHRAGSSRPLTPVEAAQVATVLSDEKNLVERTQQVQDSTLRAYDEPDAREILVASGLGVASAFVEAVREAVALIEMPGVDFEQACENGTLPEAIEQRARELRMLELGEGRKRASVAFAHYAESAGFAPGEAWSLPVRAVWQALQGAMSNLTDGSQLSQLIDSAASTEGSPAATSSSGSPGGTPSS